MAKNKKLENSSIYSNVENFGPPGQTVDTAAASPETSAPRGFFGWLKHLFSRNKIVVIPAAILLVIALLLAVPYSRNKSLGLFISRDYSVTVLDSTTDNPVSGAKVSLSGKSSETDSEGRAKIKDVPLGSAKLVITKEYFNDLSKKVQVSLDEDSNKESVKLVAIGRRVPVTVKDRLSGKPVEGVVLSAVSTDAETDENGQATIVVPADQKNLQVTMKRDGYNETNAKLTVTEKTVEENTFQITPAGRVFFLSNKSGEIDVVSTNLDGTDRKTVLAGTGEEIEYDMYLEASDDWKYLAFKSRRDSDRAKLYLIETSTGKLTVMDEGDAEFAPIGWLGHEFVYEVRREKKDWEPKQEAIKSYNADRLDITTMQESAASGNSQWNYARQIFDDYVLTSDGLVYTSSWWGDGWGAWKAGQGRKTGIYLAKVGTKEKSAVKVFDRAKASSIDAIERRPNEIDFQVYINNDEKFYKYKNGETTSVEMDSSDFYFGSNRTYIISPSGDQTFWSETRDGKSTLLVGDKNAENSKEILSLSKHQAYGWYTEDYLLTVKNGSELHIMPNDKSSKPVKISDFSSSRNKSYYH